MTAAPVFAAAAYDRLEALSACDPEVIRLITWLVTGDARPVRDVARQFFAETSLSIEHARGLLRVIDMPTPAPPSINVEGTLA